MENTKKLVKLNGFGDIKPGVELVLRDGLVDGQEYSIEGMPYDALSWHDEMVRTNYVVESIDYSDNTFKVEGCESGWWYQTAFFSHMLVDEEESVLVNCGRYADLVDKEKFLENLYNNGLETFRGYDKALADTYESKLKEDKLHDGE